MSDDDAPWHRLRGYVAPDVMAAPKTGGDPSNAGQWPGVNTRCVSYLEFNTLGKPWVNHLALIAAVMAAHRCSVQTVLQTLSKINVSFLELFEALGIKSVAEWQAEEHMLAYLKREVLADHSEQRRGFFWVKYSSATKHVRRWWKSLPGGEQIRYAPFLLPEVNPNHVRGLVKWDEIKERQRNKRKEETDAVVPHLPELRGEAHKRYNQMARLRRAYRDALAEIGRCPVELPFCFSYEEGGDPERGVQAQERWHFRVWDRRSFVLAHRDCYSKVTISSARRATDSFAPEREHFFLEFVRAERLSDDAPPVGPWFEELIRHRVLGSMPYSGTKEEVAEKQRVLRSWGYGGQDENEQLSPFKSMDEGVLVAGYKEAFFMHRAQARTGGIFVPVEEFFTAATFGLLSLDGFTTTGMRLNELLQIRLGDSCLVRVELRPSPSAKNQPPKVRYGLQLVPKGERSGAPQIFFVGRETMNLLYRTARLLEEHYGLDAAKGDKLPVVEFTYATRKEQFPPDRYLFQHSYRHLSPITVTACMRFLLHGMVFTTADGRIVVINAHLLRHVFATYAVHVAKTPVDVVAAMLKHKRIDVTNYYSQPTHGIVSDAVDGYLASFAAHVNVRDAIARSPQELQELIRGASGTYGTLSNVLGGDCVVNAPCIAKYSCLGCPGLVPDPGKRHQVEQKKQWALGQKELAEEEGLALEVRKMGKLIRDCETVLREMDSIEAYRKDERNVPIIQIERRR